MAGPLSHIRVLDLSRIMAGPWATQIFADLGADVIKVERPGAGDDTRAWGPPFLAGGDGAPTRESGYFLSVNRGKRSIALDLATPQGQEVIRRLAARCDVVVENYKAGALEKFGLAADDLRRINPRLIACSITGFGQTGPRREQAAYDFLIQAMGGLMSVTGERDSAPGGGPQKVGVPIVDIMTGMYAAVAVLAALARRERTGKGDTIDIAMLDVQVAFLANQAMNYLLAGKAPRRTGNRHPNIQPQDIFATRDGYIIIVVGNDRQFELCCQALGCAELAKDERFASNAARVRNIEALLALMGERLRTQDSAHWVEVLERVGVPSGPINGIDAALADPQVVHRGMRRDILHPTGAAVPQIVSPIRFAEAALAFDRPPPMLNQHGDDILNEIGLGEPAARPADAARTG